VKLIIRRLLFVLLLLLLAVLFYRFPNSRQIISGVAILIFGMYMLEEGFSGFAKGPLEKILRTLTKYDLGSLGLGAISTAILQSSSLITVITISFLSAGLITLSAGALIVFGANLGTTATTWLVAAIGLNLDIAALALPFIAFGIIFNFQKTLPVKGLGNILNGLGFFFLGIEYMKQGFEGLSGIIDLTAYGVDGYTGLLLYTGLGVMVTVIMQSSSAAMTLILTTLYAGQISFDNALALAIGANVGTTVTALIGGLSAGRAGKQLATIHLLFNLITAIVALALFSPFKYALRWVGNVLSIGSSEYTLMLAVFHTLFNMAGIIIVYPMRHFLIRKLTWSKDKNGKSRDLIGAMLYTGAGIHALKQRSKDFFQTLILPQLVVTLSLDKKAISNPEKAKILLERRQEFKTNDGEAYYIHTIKPAYGNLLMHMGTVELSELSRKESATVFRLKLSLRQGVSAVKQMNDLQKHLAAAFYSPQEELRNIYFEMSRIMLKTFRFSHNIPNIDNETARRDIQAFRRRLDKFEKVIYRRVQSMMGTGKLDATIMGSLMNDIYAVQRICQFCLGAALLLYTDSPQLSVEID
jgi:phosphate:Na+ symporter